MLTNNLVGRVQSLWAGGLREICDTLCAAKGGRTFLISTFFGFHRFFASDNDSDDAAAVCIDLRGRTANRLRL